MKNKAIRNEIKSSVITIKSAKKKGDVSQSPATKASLESLKSSMEKTIRLQKEVRKLKNDLKQRKKDLAAAVKKMAKGRKEVKIARKKGKKAATATRVIKVEKKPSKQVRPKAKKTLKPGIKTPKATRQTRRKKVIVTPPTETVQ